MPVDLSKPSALAKPRRPSKKDQDEDKFDSAHAREIELKRSRGEISCAECRRFDAINPSPANLARGCAALCPNGSLATGQGTRFVLAATEYLHKRIAKMNERIRQLEDALAILQARCSNEPHPLLRDDVMPTKAEQEDEDTPEVEPATSADIIDTFGTLSVSDHVNTLSGSPSESLTSRFFLLPLPVPITENDTPPSSPPVEGVSPESSRDSMTPPISGELTRFSASFPFTPIGSPTEVQELIEQYLPPWERATHLCETYLENAGWLFRGVTRQQLVVEMLPVIYRRPIPEGTRVASLDYTGPHDLALLFLVFALGSLLDLSQEPYSSEGEHYHQLARAALCLQPVLEKPSIVAIQALRLLSIYTAMSGKELRGTETTMETTWSLLALSAQLAHSIGLQSHHRSPPSFTRDYIDCKYPLLQHVDINDEVEDPEEESDEDRNDFNTWGCRFAIQCVSEVAARALAADPPSYATIMDLDRRVREFPIPREVVAILEDLKNPSEDEGPPSLTTSMERMVMSHCREVGTYLSSRPQHVRSSPAVL
ncbi:hypothetical protein NM688_g8822 [Phlebia brevispora]|uniref:Uncharacterized protein n=1 Tax=Phlebia brevispora TaxID=194682 RepID=A0ACC1RMK5_9APHY|nr:hypothetical protein NM688_g8822 [Phlebia brevispora]